MAREMHSHLFIDPHGSISKMGEGDAMIFQFHFCSDDESYSYVVGSSTSRDALIVDPVEGCIDDYTDLLARLGYALRHTIETGAVARTELAATYLSGKFGSGSVVPMGAERRGTPMRVEHGDLLHVGGLEVEVVGRPGEASPAVSYRIGDRVFVGTRQVRDEPTLLALPSDLLVYRARRLRGTHFGLLGLEAGSAMRERDRWRARIGA
jgi:glyoxylase-like metal-dependent hydrolase (beta-lactamase superfamily II)